MRDKPCARMGDKGCASDEAFENLSLAAARMESEQIDSYHQWGLWASPHTLNAAAATTSMTLPLLIQ